VLGLILTAQHLQRGAWAERLAASYLEQQGCEIIERNFRSRYGELDLVALQKTELVIVEVRYRRSIHYGRPEETVNESKQRKVVIATEYFLKRHAKYTEWPIRFDVLAISGEQAKPEIMWINNAFDGAF